MNHQSRIAGLSILVVAVILSVPRALAADPGTSSGASPDFSKIVLDHSGDIARTAGAASAYGLSRTHVIENAISQVLLDARANPLPLTHEQIRNVLSKLKGLSYHGGAGDLSLGTLEVEIDAGQVARAQRLKNAQVYSDEKIGKAVANMTGPRQGAAAGVTTVVPSGHAEALGTAAMKEAEQSTAEFAPKWEVLTIKLHPNVEVAKLTNEAGRVSTQAIYPNLERQMLAWAEQGVMVRRIVAWSFPRRVLRKTASGLLKGTATVLGGWEVYRLATEASDYLKKHNPAADSESLLKALRDKTSEARTGSLDDAHSADGGTAGPSQQSVKP